MRCTTREFISSFSSLLEAKYISEKFDSHLKVLKQFCDELDNPPVGTTLMKPPLPIKQQTLVNNGGLMRMNLDTMAQVAASAAISALGLPAEGNL